ncbi:ABC transporter substrate-binding protein [Rhizobium rhizogenes]|uniref:ABC transporter substrate-binding protein n=1 Tax=Rhizobium rhizogenes TaxID=359 RepID=UPI001573228E|nr:ABC transporter substrate-binding protein [Rhizobium rhizogenes]NTF46041.1 ABC transporter substrate-binding protein [Rhizobium rhizogenes]
MITRRQFCTSIATAAILSRVTPALAEPSFKVIDLAGRELQLAAPPKRIILLEAHDLLTMSFLHPDPASLVVGWAAVDRIDSEQLQTRLVNGHSVSVVGKQTPDTVSLEGLISLSPDLVVTNAFMTPDGDSNPMVERLKQLGIPVAYSDAASNSAASGQASDPVAELKASMQMWGTLLNATAKAEAFTSFFDRELAKIAALVKNSPPVTTYLEVQSTLDDCCWAAGRKVWGELLARAGGQPLPGVTAPWYQQLSLEYVVSTPHDVYIASGGGWASGSRPAIGPGIDPKLGREGLERLIQGRVGFDQLPSVRSKRVYGIWTGLISNLPLNVLFVAAAAKWLHPEQAANINPDAILEAINKDFAAFPIEGPLWVSI